MDEYVATFWKNLLLLASALKMEPAHSSEMLVQSSRLQSVTSQKTAIFKLPSM
jgi:hypothetical protein